ncbi:hypothetical protein [Candidatus Fukatsuia endosymbiont of Tuberolachnus salignus]
MAEMIQPGSSRTLSFDALCELATSDDFDWATDEQKETVIAKYWHNYCIKAMTRRTARDYQDGQLTFAGVVFGLIELASFLLPCGLAAKQVSKLRCCPIKSSLLQGRSVP